MGGADWPAKDILGTGSPKQVLRRLMDGDPLEIAARCEDRLRERALLVELTRLQLRTFARVAFDARTWRGRGLLHDWLIERVDRSIDELIAEDRAEERAELPPEEPFDDRYVFLSEVLGLPARRARTACLRFNALPEEVRRTFFAFFIEGHSFAEWVQEEDLPPDEVRKRLRAALRKLAAPYDDGHWLEDVVDE